MENINKKIASEKTTLFLALAFLILVTSFNPFEKTLVSILLSLMIIAVGILPYIVWRNDPNRQQILPGIIWYGIFYIICFGLTGFVEHNIRTGAYQDYSNTSEYISKMLTIMHLGIVFAVFYILNKLFKKKIEVEKTKSLPIENDNQFYFIIFLCFVITAIRVADNEIGGVVIGMMGTLSFMYLFYYIFIENKGNFFLAVIACIGYLETAGGFQGNIKPFVDLGFLIFFINLQKGRILILPALFMVLTILIYQPMKGYVRPLMTEIGVSSAESFSIGIETLEGKGLIDLVDIATSRLDHGSLLSAFVEHIDSSDYIKWKAYENLPYAPIPRFLWPGKPQEGFGNEWAVQEGWLNRDDYITSYNLPWLPQMYLSYGPFGVIIGSLLIGIILYLINRFYWTAPSRPWDHSMGLVALLMMFSLDSDFTITFGILVKFIIIDICVRLLRNTLEIQRDKSNSY